MTATIGDTNEIVLRGFCRTVNKKTAAIVMNAHEEILSLEPEYQLNHLCIANNSVKMGISVPMDSLVMKEVYRIAAMVEFFTAGTLHDS